MKNAVQRRLGHPALRVPIRKVAISAVEIAKGSRLQNEKLERPGDSPPIARSHLESCPRPRGTRRIATPDRFLQIYQLRQLRQLCQFGQPQPRHPPLRQLRHHASWIFESPCCCRFAFASWACGRTFSTRFWRVSAGSVSAILASDGIALSIVVASTIVLAPAVISV